MTEAEGSAILRASSLDELREWALWITLARDPDFIIGDNYLRRWWVIPRNPFANVYLHEFRRSDDDRALHDHPWNSTSVILQGRYIEHTPEGPIVRDEASVTSREAAALHRVELFPGETALTLFLTGPIMREWGFQCPQGWRHWREFVDERDTGAVGRGCA